MQRTSQGAAYFERPLPIALTFAAFLLVAAPLVYLRCVPNDYGVLPYLLIAEAVGLGTSHFFITLAVYLQPRNLAYFASSWQRRCIYFGLPIAIFLAVALSEGLRTRERFPGFAFYFYAGVRFFDFFHVGRQSVGMLQLFKRPLGAELPRWTRRADNVFFVGVALLQWQTFLLGGEFQAQRLSMWLPALLLAVLFVALVAVYLEAVLAPETRKDAAIALAYFVVQAACAATAAYATWLYLTVLAVHYVEYHVIMAPRLVGPKAQPSVLRGPWILYGALAALVVLFEARNYVVTDSLPLGFLVHLFDGIFLFHYVLDAFLWKFNNPYYRSVLTPLYFEPKPQRALGRARFRPGLAFALCALGVLGTAAALSGRPAGLYAITLAPLYAEEHLRWAVSLVRAGDLPGAQHHLERASELAPADQRPKGLLAAVSQQLEQVKHERR
jgi:hypothetical protein